MAVALMALKTLELVETKKSDVVGATFVPLLFLSGTASILFTQLSVVVMFSLTMSLFVAVTIVPVLW